MLRVAFVIYRSWGYEIFKDILEYQKLRNDFEISALITNKKPEFNISPSLKRKVKVYQVDPNDQEKILAILNKHKVEIVFLYSWSYIIKNEILDKFICLCLHPSLLPSYRGGTPIQNQLTRGERNSGITVFKMNEGIDSGDIYRQCVMSLCGDINDIFARMANLGTIISKDIITDSINGELIFHPQKGIKNSQVFKRRKPHESEIFLDNLKNMNFEAINNLVRGLLDPYPSAFIKTENFQIFIYQIIKYKSVFKEGVILDKKTTRRDIKRKKLFLQIKGGYALLAKYKF